MGDSQNYGYLFGGPHNEDDSGLVSIFGSPDFRKLLYKGYIGIILGYIRDYLRSI